MKLWVTRVVNNKCASVKENHIHRVDYHSLGCGGKFCASMVSLK